MPKWYEWQTPWREFECGERPCRMRVEYGLDEVNDPPLFHFHAEIEEKARNNRWYPGGSWEVRPDPVAIFPELASAARWRDFQPSEHPRHIRDARLYWEQMLGRIALKRGGFQEEPGPDPTEEFMRTIFFGNVPGDELPPQEPRSWFAVETWIRDRHPNLLRAFKRDYARMPIPVEGTGQQDMLRLLPVGVRKVIRAYAERIQAIAPGRVLWDRILGCGHYGCVMPIEGTDLVLKVSTDASEGPVVQAIMNTGLDKELDGLVKYDSVWKISGYEGRGQRAAAYAIIRQAVEPYQSDVRREWIGALFDYNEATRRELRLKRPHLSDEAHGDAMAALDRLYNFEETFPVAEAFRILRNEDIVLSDVHAGNIGSGPNSPIVRWSDGENRPALLIFDPGHSSAPDTEMAILP